MILTLIKMKIYMETQIVSMKKPRGADKIKIAEQI
jgi:hypothetical protein